MEAFDELPSGDTVWDFDLQELSHMLESTEQTVEGIGSEFQNTTSEDSVTLQQSQASEPSNERDTTSSRLQPGTVPSSSVLLTRRRIHSGHCALVRFTRGQGKPVKHEYYGAMVVRGLKKAMRVSDKAVGRIPSTGLYKFISGNSYAMEQWWTFTKVYQRYHDVLHDFSLTAAEPGARERTNDSASNVQHRSFSKSFLHSFFASAYVRCAFHFYIEAAFSLPPDALCECFKFKCCQERPHSAACKALWSALKEYTQTAFLEEVGWPAFSNSNSL